MVDYRSSFMSDEKRVSSHPVAEADQYNSWTGYKSPRKEFDRIMFEQRHAVPAESDTPEPSEFARRNGSV
jgi:hypothetical protein